MKPMNRLQSRQENQNRRRLKAAGFPYLKTNVWVALDVVLFVQYRVFPADKQDRSMGIQFSHFVNGHQVAARLLEVG